MVTLFLSLRYAILSATAEAKEKVSPFIYAERLRRQGIRKRIRAFVDCLKKMYDISAETSEPQVLRISPLMDEWGSSKGGISTLNREMCKGLAQQPNVAVNLVVLEFTEVEKEEALNDGVNLVKVEEIPGFHRISLLSFPPDDCEIDAVVGHGYKLGPPAFAVAKQRRCKRVHVVHTASEELAMLKIGQTKRISDGEKKHQIEVKLSKVADVIVGIGPKLTDSIKRSLRAHQRDEEVINFTPGIFTEFSKLEQARKDGKTFSILLFGRGNEEDFEVKGYDVAARAIAATEEDSPCNLVFVGAAEGEQGEVAERLLKYGINRSQLIVRTFCESRKDLASEFLAADLAIMPSRTEGFGLAALEALSAGLPILVSANSGFGQVLKELTLGSSFVVDSEDPSTWKEAIRRVRKKSRDVRLREAFDLRKYYDEKYKWQEQCEKILRKLREFK